MGSDLYIGWKIYATRGACNIARREYVEYLSIESNRGPRSIMRDIDRSIEGRLYLNEIENFESRDVYEVFMIHNHVDIISMVKYIL